MRACLLAAVVWCAGQAVAAPAGRSPLAAGPEVAAEGRGARITFTLAAPGDVEVAVLDGAGKVIRHLAAGVLGGPLPAPAPLKAGLRQELTWDGADDDGKPAAGGPFRIRLRAGLRPAFGGAIGEPGRIRGKVFGLATDEKGNLYVASGCVYANAPIFSIKAFDRGGKYLRTVLPMPASLPAEQAAEYGGASRADGRLQPANHNPLVPYVQEGGIVAFLGSVVRDGAIWLANTEGRICRIRTDGAPLKWATGPKSLRPSGGPMCWAVSPDGGRLCMAGWWDQRSTQSKGKIPPGDGILYEVAPATGRHRELLRIDVPADSYWLTEVNGWYHFTNWGRKNGCAALHGLAVDAAGRVVACDRVNQRLAVYTPDGKLAGQTRIDWPDLVALAPKGDTAYVVTRKIIDGYKAINEFRVVKLSAAVDGKVLAELTLKGENAPCMALDASASPVVIWLSNVGKGGESLVRIEDRGAELVVAGSLGDGLPPAGNIVKVWVDPAGDDVYVNDGWNGLSRYDGLTGRGGPIPVKAIDLAVGPDGNLYLYGREGWNEPIYRCDRDFKPVPFAGTGKPTTTKSSAGREVYGRYGTGWSNKDLTVARDGRIYVRSMYDWHKYFVAAFAADGTAIQGQRVAGGVLGPLDAASGGLRVDRAGNFYVGTHARPAGAPKGDPRSGCVVKVGPEGGGIAPQKADADGVAFDGYFFEGATTVYGDLSPRADTGCVCKEGRFDLDGFGRLYVPDVLGFCIRIYDNAGNLICRLGHYGNADSAGPGSPAPEPPIPFGWPLSCSVNRAGRLYVADVLNQRIIRVDLGWASESILPCP